MPLRGDRLFELRSKSGLTQEELAARLELSIQQINRYEKGKTDPAGEILARIAREFGVTVDFLLGLTDDPYQHLREEDLSDMERKLLEAYRNGDLRLALRIMDAPRDIQEGGGKHDDVAPGKTA